MLRPRSARQWWRTAGPNRLGLQTWVRGYRTSVFLEPEFWQAFPETATWEDIALNKLSKRIDADHGMEAWLA